MDGRPHRFIGSLTVFDPRTHGFSRLEIPARPGEDFMCDYLLEVEGHLYMLAVDGKAPRTAVVMRTAPPGSATLKPGDVPMRRPVVFSYNHPWGSSNLATEGWNDPWFMDFDRVRLSTANMVDHVSPQAYAPWRTPDRRILARVRQWAYPWRDDKANDLIRHWDEALSQEGIDGFAMDEFISTDVTPELMEVWVTAITEIRRRHPDKILAFWTASVGRRELHGEDHKPLVQALRDHSDFIMPEIYYKSSTQTDFATADAPFALFREMVEDWEAQAPGSAPKVLIGLGTVQNVDWAYDDLPEVVDYGEFLGKQVEVCATDPVLRQTAGLALYAPGYLRPETLGRVNAAIIEFYGLPEEAPVGDAP